MVLSILRGVFVLLIAAVTALYVLPFQANTSLDFQTTAATLLIATGTAILIVAVDIFTPRKRLSALSGVFLGLMGGLLAAYALSFVVDLAALILFSDEVAGPQGSIFNIIQGIKVLIGLIACYISISLVLQTKDDFRFVIPYVEFAKQVRGPRPMLLDTSVIIDGRVLDLVKTKFIVSALIVPRFVLQELHTLSDSADKLKRARGRRGLDIINKLQHESDAVVSIHDADAEGAGVDQKLISLATEIKAVLMTNDFNLAKLAAVRNVDALSLHDLAGALKPVVLPGEVMMLRVSKPGENPNQGVGYLEDGTMVVIENGRSAVGQDVSATVTSTLQTSAGRMIFARLGAVNGSDPNNAPSHPAGGYPDTDEPSPQRAHPASGSRNPRR